MWPIAEIFEAELRKNYITAFKVEFLDTNFDTVGYLANGIDPVVDLTDFVADGNVDVDVERGTRRTAELTLLNPSAYYTPTVTDGDWDGLVYLNRVIRLSRGVFVEGVESPYLAPVGTFMVDRAETIVERNMSTVVITLSDLWKKLTKSKWTTPVTYIAGATYNDIIDDIITAAGADLPLTPSIDALTSRLTEDKTIQVDLVFEEGDSRGDRLHELAIAWGIDMYFDPEGRFITIDAVNNLSEIPSWSFYSSPYATGMLTSLRRSFSDESLYNHIVVVGGDFCNFIRQEQTDNDPESLTSVAEIGDRTLIIKDEKLDTSTKVATALINAWNKRLQIDEIIEGEVICNPALEGNDIVEIIEEDFALVNETYKLKRFNVPFVTSRQTIQAVDIINLTIESSCIVMSGVSGMNLVGNAALSGSSIRLTPSSTLQKGAAWYGTKVDVAAGFDTTFTFNMHNLSGGGADGIAFVIQNTSGTSLGSIGGGLGYHGILNSIAVEFDTWENPERGDSNANHVAVHTNGTGANSVDDSFRLDYTDLGINLSDAADHTVRIRYVPNTLDVWLDDIDDLDTPVLTLAIDIDATITLDSGKAYVGFTSATGTAYEAHDIVSWEYCWT